MFDLVQVAFVKVEQGLLRNAISVVFRLTHLDERLELYNLVVSSVILELFCEGFSIHPLEEIFQLILSLLRDVVESNFLDCDCHIPKLEVFEVLSVPFEEFLVVSWSD